MKTVYWILIVGLMPIFCKAHAQEAPMVYSNGRIFSNAVLPPPGTFLLIRKNEALCAIQFTGIWRGNDRGNSSFFHSGDESFRANYSWYVGAKVSDRWVIHPPKASGKSELLQERLVGLGKFAFGNSNVHIKCGSILLDWSAPANVYFSYRRMEEQGNEIAVTKWTKFEDIDPNDQGLQWLRYDTKRPDIVIPLEH